MITKMPDSIKEIHTELLKINEVIKDKIYFVDDTFNDRGSVVIKEINYEITHLQELLKIGVTSCNIEMYENRFKRHKTDLKKLRDEIITESIKEK